MKNKLYILNSFTSENGGGNTAGVIFESDLIPEQIIALAKNYQLSEIAVLHSNNNSYKIKFYTPNSEIDFCGHATIALFGLMKKLNLINDGSYSVQTMAGEIEVIIEEMMIWTVQPLPKFGELINKEKIAQSLNTNSNLSGCQKVSTGLFDIMIGVNSLEELQNIKPNFKLVEKVSVDHDSVGYHLFHIGQDIYTRNFAPRFAIDEESATGSASGALACYLYQEGLIELNKQYVFKQGYFMNQPSNIFVKLVGESTIERVLVGGRIGNYSIEKTLLDIN